MLEKFLQKLKDVKSEMSTYRFGLLQTQAYRILKSETARLLERYNISTVEWAILGALYDAKEGVTPSEMAEVMDVELPFVTATVNTLSDKGLISTKRSAEDKRSKSIQLTAVAVKLVPQIEVFLRKETRFLVADISIKDLFAYRRVMIAIIANSKKNT